MSKAMGGIRVKQTRKLDAGKLIQSELSRIAARYGFTIKFYRGEGKEGGTGGFDNEIEINLNKIGGLQYYYLKGVEITLENKHVFTMPYSKSVVFHEIAHRMFSKKSDLGHDILKEIKKLKASGEYGQPTEYAVLTNEFEGMMEFYSFYKLAPTKLKRTQPKIYTLMKRWEHEYFRK